ncbi:penicillin-binding transpeptidase domain-containing protein [Waddlia chondrophila]|nr:penicillin-binding transpeptidase domain-containing protein [Waddlia chondrophila]
MPKRRRRARPRLTIEEKAAKVLNLVFIGFLLITLRSWHLSVILHEEKLEEARRPQKRVVIESSKRGTIRDRFNIPLAINKMQYNLAISYAQIRQIPGVVWEKENGKKVKRYIRREYIEKLSAVVGEELHLDPDYVEDLIYSKAALFHHLPYVVKEDISEGQYYRLKMLERDYPGLHTQSVPKRYYPYGKVGGEMIGYIGAISRQEYESVVQEIKSLEEWLGKYEMGQDPELPEGIETVEGVEKRYKEMVEHAYSINDYVGKMGIEGKFEEVLRGYHGKKAFASDAQGNIIQELLEGKEPQSGSRVLLTISQELQEYAEKLLIQNEAVRVPRVSRVNAQSRKKLEEKQHWIKGGAIVAMDPFSGDVLALASYPRCDPNDFISSGNGEERARKTANIRKWFETEEYIADVWNQKRPLDREFFDLKTEQIAEEAIWVDWQTYLEMILPIDSPIIEALNRVGSVKNAVIIQKHLEKLLVFSPSQSAYALFNQLYSDPPHQLYGRRLPAVQQEHLEEAVEKHRETVQFHKKALDPFFNGLESNYDKVMFLDLVRIVVDPERISDTLLKEIGSQSLVEYRNAQSAFVLIEETVRQMIWELFREVHFKRWRDLYQKEFLKQKRREEKINKVRYAKPYLDLLEQQELLMFQEFWEQHRYALLATFMTGVSFQDYPEIKPYQEMLASWEKELKGGAHQALSWSRSYWKLHQSVDGLSPEMVQDYLAGLRGFDRLNRSLLGRYRHLRSQDGQQLEKHLAAGFYPNYGYGFARSHAYRQAAVQGSIFKIVTAYEALVQTFNAFQGKQAGEIHLNPLIMVDDIYKSGKATFVGYDKNGKPIPQFYKGGRIPRSHRSGMGKMDLVRAIEMSSDPYFSLLAVDVLANPEDLARAARDFSFGSKTGIDLPAEIPGQIPYDLSVNRNGLYAMAIGQHSLVVTPLQTAVMLSAVANGGKVLKPKIVNMIVGKNEKNEGTILSFDPVVNNRIFMPDAVREVLLEGMYRAVFRSQTASLGSLSHLYENYPEAISDFIELKNQLVGKSSTAESMEQLDLDQNLGTNLYNHIWFGGILYTPDQKSEPKTFVFNDRFGTPELVVVVYLRFGAWGKDASPLAAQVAQKWREIKSKHLSRS